MTRSLRAPGLALALLLLAAPLLTAPALSEGPGAREEWLSTPVLAYLRGLPSSVAEPDAPLLAGDVKVTTSGAAQNEPAVAVNPLDPKNVLVGWNDYDSAASGAYVWTGIGTSTDGGATWNSRILAPSPKGIPALVRNLLAEFDVPFTFAGDPIVAFNQLGVGLAGGLVAGQNLFQDSALYVQATLDKGTTFLPPIYAAWSGYTVPTGLTDKPWMRGDLNSKWFYICWTHFSGDINIWFTRSGDGLGLVWEAPEKLSTEGGVQGCDIGIGPGGEVYVVYLDFIFGLTGGGTMKVFKSTDNGDTFTGPVTIAGVQPLSLPNSAFRYQHFPRIAVDQGNGHVYVAWAEGTGGDIVLTKSTDGGATWSPKKLVNNDGTGKAQHMPSIHVAPDGKVVVGFYDRRDDAGNRIMRYYLAESTDGGASFPLQYPAGASTVDGLNTRWWFMGDYTDLRIGSDGKPHAVWTAAPGTNQDIYTTAP